MSAIKTFFILFSISILTIFAVIPVEAQETDSVKVYYLDDIIITATRAEKHASDVSRSLSIISKRELENSVYLSPADLISQREGVLITGNGQNPGSLQSIYMRGANNNQTVIMVDGIRITDPSSVENAIDFSEMSLTNFERIEMIRGSHSTLYGSSAIGGVINFITEKNQKAGLNAELYTRAGTFGKGTSDFSQNLFLNYTLNNGLYFNGVLFNTFVNGMDATVDTVTNPAVYNRRDKDNLKKTDFLFKTGLINNYWDAYVLYKRTDQKTDIDKRAYIDDDNYTANFERNLINYGVSFKINKDIKINFIGGLSDMRRTAVDDSSLVDNQGTYDHTYSKNRYKGGLYNNELQANFNFNHIGVVIGGGINKETMTSDSYIFANSGFGIYESESDLDTLNIEATTKNIFAHIDISGSALSGDFTLFNLALGARYNNHSAFGSTYTYEINPSYKITDAGIFYASYSTGFNAPSLYRLYTPETNYISGISRGNSNLKPERSTSYEIGYRHTFSEKTQFSIAIFNTKTTNIQEYVYLWDKDIAISDLGNDWLRDDNRGDTYINAGDMTTKGLEFAFSTKIMNKLSFTGNLSWVNGEQKYKDKVDTEQTGGNWVQLYSTGAFLTENITAKGLVRRANTANLAAVYLPCDILILGLNIKYVGKKDDIFYNSQKGPWGALDTKAISDYTLFDVSAKFVVSEQMMIMMRIENLFDKNYFEINGYSTRGRSAYLALKYAL